jgi:hypothetical protein
MSTDGQNLRRGDLRYFCRATPYIDRVGRGHDWQGKCGPSPERPHCEDQAAFLARRPLPGVGAFDGKVFLRCCPKPIVFANSERALA